MRRWRRDLAFAWGLARRRPFQVLVQVTNRCNLRCDFCDFWPHGARPGDELTVADYARIADELDGVGTFLVSIEGGEPLVRPDLLDIVAAFADRHVPVLYTNGWYVDAAMADALFEAGVGQVGVSIDYPDAARHDARRGLEGAFDRAWQAVAHLSAAAPDGGRQVHVMTTLMDDNVADLGGLLHQSARAGVGHHVTLVSDSGYRRGEGATRPLPGVGAALASLARQFPHLRAPRSYVAGMDPFLDGEELPPCNAGRWSFNVDHLGEVSPCVEWIDRSVGNVRERSIPELLDALDALRDQVAGCQACWTLCRGISQGLGGRRGPSTWVDLARMRSA